MKKDKKISKKENVGRDQYTIVLEDLRSNFRAFGEGLLGLNEKVDNGFKDVNRRLDGHSEMIGRLMVDMTEVKTDITEIKTDITELKTDMKEVLKVI